MEHQLDTPATNPTSTAAAGEEMLRLVPFMLGPEEFAVDISVVQGIDRKLEITKVPRAPDSVKGVINLRGKIVPVVDLRKRFGLPWQEFTGESRIIVVNVGMRILGLMVDSVSKVLSAPAHAVKPAPSVVAGIEVKHIKGVLKIDRRLLILLDLGQLLKDRG
jgi:purine-binding chemotaxis protein CheW